MAGNVGPEVIYPELSFQIMAAAFEVHNQLGPGYSEDIYEEAMVIELAERGIPFEKQKVIQVSYKSKPVGIYRLDLVIDGKIILELKAVAELIPLHHQQVYSYLKALDYRLGILINFGAVKVQSKRILHK